MYFSYISNVLHALIYLIDHHSVPPWGMLLILVWQVEKLRINDLPKLYRLGAKTDSNLFLPDLSPYFSLTSPGHLIFVIFSHLILLSFIILLVCSESSPVCSIYQQ